MLHSYMTFRKVSLLVMRLTDAVFSYQCGLRNSANDTVHIYFHPTGMCDMPCIDVHGYILQHFVLHGETFSSVFAPLKLHY